jgi:branched-chain amino acid transport system permease protein
MIDILPDLALSALVLGSIYALFAVSLNIVWSMANVVNIGHREVLTLGAYGTLAVDGSTSGALLPLGFLALGLVTVIVSAVLYWVMLWGLRERDLHYGSLLLTWGISLAILAAIRIVVGTQFQSVGILRESVTIGPLRTTQAALLALAVALIVSAGLALVLQRTAIGRSLRAIAANVDLAASVGINVPRVRTVAFVGGILITVLAGVLLSMLYVFYPLVGQLFIIKAVAIVLVAGLGRLAWTWMVGMGLGLVETAVQFQMGAQVSSLVAYIALILVLLFRRDDVVRLARRFVSRRREQGLGAAHG